MDTTSAFAQTGYFQDYSIAFSKEFEHSFQKLKIVVASKSVKGNWYFKRTIVYKGLEYNSERTSVAFAVYSFSNLIILKLFGRQGCSNSENIEDIKKDQGRIIEKYFNFLSSHSN